VNLVAFAVSVIFGLMLAEQQLSSRNERSLRAAGAVEPPGDLYWPLAVAYPLAFLAMGLEGAWRAAHDTGPSSGPSWAASGVVLFVASKALKYWAIRTLGERWSFRVLTLPGRPLVAIGPYRYLDHPNYVAVVGELVGTALMVTAPLTGPLAFVIFGALLWRRWRFEHRALSGLRKQLSPGSVD